MKRLLILAILLILTACAAPITVTPTPSPTSTATSTPSPTSTTLSETPLNAATSTAYPTPPPDFPRATPIAYPDVPISYAPSHMLGREGQHIRLGLGQMYDLALSPDGHRLAIGTAIGVYLYDVDTFEEIWSVRMREILHELKWSPDGSKIAVYSGRNKTGNHLSIIDAETGELPVLYEQFYGYQFDVMSYSWMQDSITLAAGITFQTEDPARGIYDETKFVLFNTEDHLQNHYFPVEVEPLRIMGDIAFSPDETLLAFVYDQYTIYLIDMQTGTIRHTLEHEFRPLSSNSDIRRIEFSPDGHKVATYTGVTGPSDAPSGAPTVWIWDVQTGELDHRLEHPDGYTVTDVAWTKSGSRLVSIASDFQTSQTIVWDANNGEAIHTSEWGSGYELALSPDEQYVVSPGGYLGWLTMLDIDTGQLIEYLGYHGDSYTKTISPVWLPDGRSFIAAAGNMVVRWSVENTRPTQLFYANPVADWLMWSPDGTKIAAVIDSGDEIKGTIWDTSTGEYLESFVGDQAVQDWFYHRDYIERDLDAEPVIPDAYNEIHYSHNGQLRLTTWLDWPTHPELIGPIPVTTFYLWDNPENELRRRFTESGVQLRSLSFSPDSHWLALGHDGSYLGFLGPPSEFYVSIWNVGIGTPQTIGDFYGHAGGVFELSWSPDSKRFASRSEDGTVIIWNLHTGPNYQ